MSRRGCAHGLRAGRSREDRLLLHIPGTSLELARAVGTRAPPGPSIQARQALGLAKEHSCWVTEVSQRAPARTSRTGMSLPLLPSGAERNPVREENQGPFGQPETPSPNPETGPRPWSDGH